MSLHRSFRHFTALTTLLGWSAGTAAPTQGQEPEVKDDDQERLYELEALVVEDTPLDPSRIAGSAHSVSEEEFERDKPIDPQRLLLRVPGVYMRTEDGFGLRPNIGLRGASSNRSSKVTLMEDGILLAPAPYSAPAAYYFPVAARMTGLDVYKGPAAIQYGPNTIGGALNWRTRAVPDTSSGGLDVAAGTYRFGKAHGHWGMSSKHAGMLIDGIHLQTNGFKDLDGGGPTGFDKNEGMLKLHVNSDPDAVGFHKLQLKLGYSDESSSETYLGLNDADFARTPYRRYAASQLGLMDWHRTQVELQHTFSWSDSLEVVTTAYRHDFERTWRKLNRFCSGPSDPNDTSLRTCGDPQLDEILKGADSGSNAIYMSVLRGEQDSVGNDQILMIGSNERRYVSQGLQSVGRLRLDAGEFVHDVEVGARLHHDRVARDHTEQEHLMQSGKLVQRDHLIDDALRNRAHTVALALHALDQVTLGNWMVTPGIRSEFIWNEFQDRIGGTEVASFRAALLPGIGSLYRLPFGMSLLGGVFRGFSPVSPGQPNEVDPELSWNYEAGARYQRETFRAELIGFFNDYNNLTGECTFALGCDNALVNTQFNAGEVDVYGLEASAQLVEPLRFGWSVRGQGAYTFTLSEFKTDFTTNVGSETNVSADTAFGQVEAGDELPYVPRHQGSVILGVFNEQFRLDLTASYVGEMRDLAGKGPIPDVERIENYVLVDAIAGYKPYPFNELYLQINNAFANDYLASRRPFGARPGSPFMLLVGYTHDFGG